MQRKRVVALPLQILLWVSHYYNILWFSLSMIVMCWKGYKLFYTKSSFRFDIALICINTFTEHCRQMLATRGNLTDSATPLLWSLGFSCLVLMAHVYFFSLQVYVLRVDRVLNGGALGVLSTGALLSLGALVEMGRH